MSIARLKNLPMHSVPALIISALVLSGCAALKQDHRQPMDSPQSEFQRGGSSAAVNVHWLADLDSDELNLDALIIEALGKNFQLQQAAARVEQARQSVIVARSDRLPALGLAVSGTRRETSAGSVNSVSESYQASIEAQWEIDFWGRLSQSQRAASLTLAAQEASFEAARRQLAADVARSLFDFIEAQQLQAVFERRLENVSQSLDIVDSGYRQGLNEALDLYLAQNSVQQEIANLAQQRQTRLETTARLQLLLARYPDGKLTAATELPVIDSAIPVGLASELLTRRADIQQAWLNLLAADARRASAHRARFPRLSLVGSGGSVSTELSDLLEADDPVWSLLTNVTAPLFDAGRLRALDAQAQAVAREAEQQYLELSYRAFAEVENAISRMTTLTDRHNAFVLAEENAAAALELALEQYQAGLVAYTTVLESQRRAFDATTTVVQLRNQLLQNRIALHLAVGGEFTVN